MKSFFSTLLFTIFLAACEPINDPVPPCDCEQDFTILVESVVSKITSSSSPEWEVEAGKGKRFGVRGGVKSGKRIKSDREESYRHLPFSEDDQKKLALIGAFYRRECLNLCKDSGMSAQQFSEKMRELNKETERKTWDALDKVSDKRNVEPNRTPPITVKEKHYCVSDDGIQLVENILSVRYQCPGAGRNFRLVATADLANGLSETSLSFLIAKQHPTESSVSFDLSELNWQHLSSSEQAGLRIKEVRISIPVKGGGEKQVATIQF